MAYMRLPTPSEGTNSKPQDISLVYINPIEGPLED
jgi:hypothetical protein